MDAEEIEITPELAKALADAHERGDAQIQRFLEEGILLSPEDMGERMGLTPEAVVAFFQEDRLIGVRKGGRILFMADQLDADGKPYAGIAKALEILDNGWEAFRFLMAKERGTTNQSRMAAGDVADLVVMAETWRRGDFW